MGRLILMFALALLIPQQSFAVEATGDWNLVNEGPYADSKLKGSAFPDASDKAWVEEEAALFGVSRAALELCKDDIKALADAVAFEPVNREQELRKAIRLKFLIMKDCTAPKNYPKNLGDTLTAPVK